MANQATISYTATAGQTTFSFSSIEMIEDFSTMNAIVNSIIQIEGSDFNIVGTDVVFVVGLAEDDAVVLARNTNIDNPIVSYNNTAVLPQEDLNLMVDQLLFRLQEVSEIGEQGFSQALLDLAEDIGTNSTIIDDHEDRLDVIEGGSMYPIGSIYMNATTTDPATMLGFGNWLEFGEGQVLVGKAPTGTFDTAGNTGGLEAVSLTASELAPHTHTYDKPTQLGVSDGTGDFSIQAVATAQNTGSVGAGDAHENMPPYIVVYMWVRIAD
jgi:hypothetical protein